MLFRSIAGPVLYRTGDAETGVVTVRVLSRHELADNVVQRSESRARVVLLCEHFQLRTLDLDDCKRGLGATDITGKHFYVPISHFNTRPLVSAVYSLLIGIRFTGAGLDGIREFTEPVFADFTQRTGTIETFQEILCPVYEQRVIAWYRDTDRFIVEQREQ